MRCVLLNSEVLNDDCLEVTSPEWVERGVMLAKMKNGVKPFSVMC